MSLNRGEKIAVAIGALLGLSLSIWATFYCGRDCPDSLLVLLAIIPSIPWFFVVVIAQGMGNAFPDVEVSTTVIAAMNIVQAIWFGVFYGSVFYVLYRFVIAPIVTRLRKR